MKQIVRIQKWLNQFDIHLLPLTILRALASSILPFIEVFWSTKIVQMILDNQMDFTVLRKYLMLMVASYILKEFLVSILNYVIEKRVYELKQTMDQAIHLKSLSLDYETLEKPETLQLVQIAKEAQNAMGGVEAWFIYISRIIESAFTTIFSIALTLTLLLQVSSDPINSFATFLSSKWGSILIVASIILNLFCQFRFSKKINQIRIASAKSNITNNRQSAYLSDLMSQDYNYGKVIRLYDMKGMLSNKMRQFFDDSLVTYSKWYRLTGLVGSSSQIVNAIWSVPLYLVVMVRAFMGIFPGGQVILYIQGLSQLFKAITTLITNYSLLLSNCECFDTYIEFINLESHQMRGNLHLEKREDHDYKITFENVSFKYPGTKEYALKNINYTFDLHTKLAIVGTNGAGKTTFIKLLCRMYQPTSGVIKLNGVPIEKYSFHEYVQLLSVVFQDFQLLGLPVGDVIASSKDYDAKRIEEILVEVGMEKFYERLPQGLDTYLYKYNEAGVEVSGGEAQKLAIARALYKDGSYVILDEPTAALDPLSEYEIYKNFDDMVKDKTSVYISHRMSSCKFCDHILVMSNGKIVEQGNHNALVSGKGLYEEMWNAQAQYYKD